MIVIADSGSTKTAWRILADGKIEQESTLGFNPYFLGEKEMQRELGSSFLVELSNVEAL